MTVSEVEHGSDLVLKKLQRQNIELAKSNAAFQQNMRRVKTELMELQSDHLKLRQIHEATKQELAELKVPNCLFRVYFRIRCLVSL